MATSDPLPRSQPLRWALAVAAVGGLLAVAWGWRPPPQMGSAQDTFKTVDALYTAVTGRSDQQLADCEARLHAARDAGRLPAAAADHLDGIIGRARAGRWESAAERLYDFMLAQRREGELPPPAPKPKAKK